MAAHGLAGWLATLAGSLGSGQSTVMAVSPVSASSGIHYTGGFQKSGEQDDINV